MNAEILTLMNPSGINLDHIPGGIAALTAQDVAAALTGSTRAELALCLYKDCRSDSDVHNRFQKKERPRLEVGLSLAAIKCDEYKAFKKHSPEKLLTLVNLVIDEFCTLPHCPACSGTGVDSQYQPCKPCDGTKIKTMSQSYKAKVMGENGHSGWRKHRDMYHALMKVLQAWDEANNRKLRRRLK